MRNKHFWGDNIKKLLTILLTLTMLTACTAQPTAVEPAPKETTDPLETTSLETSTMDTTEPVATTEAKELTEVEQKLLALSEKTISEYTEDDFIFLLSTDLSCHASAFDLDTSKPIIWSDVYGSSFSSFIFPTNLCDTVTLFFGSYGGEDEHDVTIKDIMKGAPDMISITFNTELMADDEVVLGKFKKGMSLEEVKQAAVGEEIVSEDDVTFYEVHEEKVYYRIWLTDSDELAVIQVYKANP